MSHVGDCDAVLRRFDLIDAHDQPGLRVFDVPVRIDHARSVLKDRFDLLRDLRLAGKVGTVNLSYQRLHNRGPWRNFAHLDTRTVGVADRIEQRSEPLCDGMALRAALLCRQQVHLNVGLIRLAAHVVVAHQPVEVIGTGGSGVGLVVQHLRLPRKLFAQCLRPRALFVRAACHRAC